MRGQRLDPGVSFNLIGDIEQNALLQIAVRRQQRHEAALGLEDGVRLQRERALLTLAHLRWGEELVEMG